MGLNPIFFYQIMNYISKVEGIRYINKELKKYVREFHSYNKIIKELLNIKTNIPIYVNDDLIFLPTKRFNSYDCFWINYKNISTFIESGCKTIVKFKNGEIKDFDIRIKRLERIINDALKIIDYFMKNKL